MSKLNSYKQISANMIATKLLCTTLLHNYLVPVPTPKFILKLNTNYRIVVDA